MASLRGRKRPAEAAGERGWDGDAGGSPAGAAAAAAAEPARLPAGLQPDDGALLPALRLQPQLPGLGQGGGVVPRRLRREAGALQPPPDGRLRPADARHRPAQGRRLRGGGGGGGGGGPTGPRALARGAAAAGPGAFCPSGARYPPRLLARPLRDAAAGADGAPRRSERPLAFLSPGAFLHGRPPRFSFSDRAHGRTFRRLGGKGAAFRTANNARSWPPTPRFPLPSAPPAP